MRSFSQATMIALLLSAAGSTSSLVNKTPTSLCYLLKQHPSQDTLLHTSHPPFLCSASPSQPPSAQIPMQSKKLV
ncbi:hypothetical protein BC829DRAFT_387284, partial [Chytridium lagenaria]